MSQLLDRLQQDHRHLLRLLDLLDRLLNMFREGNEPDYELMCELLEYMENYADQVHHPTEDRIFERILAISEEHRPVLDLLSKQHEVLGEINRQFRESLEGIVREEVLRRDLVEAHGREMVRTLREHLILEEREAFPLARKLLTERDWEELEQQTPRTADPVFGDRDPARFQALYQHLMSQAAP